MPKVLLIDDEAPIRLLCRVNLEAEGFEVVEAADGPAGLEKAREEQPDLILLDVMMPALDGWRVAAQLVENKRTSNIPFIFLTPRYKYRDRLYGLELGAVDYIAAPFNPLELAPRIDGVLERISRGERYQVRAEKIAEVERLIENDPDGPETRPYDLMSYR